MKVLYVWFAIVRFHRIFANQNWYKHQSNSSMDVPKIRFGLPVGAQPYIDFTTVAEREQRKKAEGMENIS